MEEGGKGHRVETLQELQGYVQHPTLHSEVGTLNPAD